MHSSDPFLASINLEQDLGHPERFAHFQPTIRSCEVMFSILDGKPSSSSIIVAPYGSGKSLSSGVAMMLVDNAPASSEELKVMARGIARVSAKAGRLARARVRSALRGLPLVLEGYQRRPSKQLLRQAKSALGAITARDDGDLIGVLEAIRRKAHRRGYDRIAIVWDEFGSHLEKLAANGRTGSLAEVQRMAEWAVRQSSPGVTLSLLLHQGFARYASGLSQSAQTSWRKIEGRFHAVNHVENSRESCELVAATLASTSEKRKSVARIDFSKMAKAARKLGLFPEFSADAELADLIRQTYPFHPAALHVIPRLAIRLAQNERSILSFVQSMDRSRPQKLIDLYRYFSGVMEADTGVGGVRRRWLEAQSALSKTETEAEREAVCAVSLLGLGASGERLRVPRELLGFALQVPGSFNKVAADRLIKYLEKKGILLYRSRTDDISVWHGTEVDVWGKLEEQKQRFSDRVDLVDVLSLEHPAPHWRPVAHNVEHNICRHFEGVYIRGSDLLRSGRSHPSLAVEAGVDGRIIFCLVESNTESAKIVKAIKNGDFGRDDGIVWAIPQSSLGLTELLREALALRTMLDDREFINADLFVRPETEELLSATQEALAKRVTSLVAPGRGETVWYSRGKKLDVGDEADLRWELSALADRRFRLTPRLGNEMICRRSVSRPAANARRTLIMGILERTGQFHLGLNRDETSPVASLYRTVLLNTGIFDGERWSSDGRRIANTGLRQIWKDLRQFFQEKGTDKRPEVLLQAFQQPPYGARAGVLPVLFAAGYSAFAEAIAIRMDGRYLADILPSTIDRICAHPEQFTVEVFGVTPAREHYLRNLIELFGQQPGPGELIRQVHDARIGWLAEQSPIALTTRDISDEAIDLRDAIKGDTDTDSLALCALPRFAGRRGGDAKTIAHLRIRLDEVRLAAKHQSNAAIAIVRNLLTIDADSSADSLGRASEWAYAVGGNGVGQKQLGPVALAILKRALAADSGQYNEITFVQALGAILLERNPDHWDEASVRAFRSKLRQVVTEIESAALEQSNPDPSLAPLIRQRISSLYRTLSVTEGDASARAFVDSLRERRREAQQPRNEQ